MSGHNVEFLFPHSCMSCILSCILRFSSCMHLGLVHMSCIVPSYTQFSKDPSLRVCYLDWLQFSRCILLCLWVSSDPLIPGAPFSVDPPVASHREKKFKPPLAKLAWTIWLGSKLLQNPSKLVWRPPVTRAGGPNCRLAYSTHLRSFLY